MKINKLIFDVFLCISNFFLLLSFILKVYNKYKDNNSIIMPIENLIFLLSYIILSLITYLIYPVNNLYNIVLYIIILILIIIFLFLSINSNIKVIIYKFFKNLI